MSEQKSFLKRIYEDQYKKLLIIPFLVLILALAQIGLQYSSTGDFMNRGVSLKGGVTITVPEVTNDPSEVRSQLEAQFSTADIEVRRISRTTGLIIDAADVDPEALVSGAESLLGLNRDSFSVEQIGSTLGASFFKQTFLAMIVAFFLMGLIVLITFRTFVPSIAVILAAASDIIVTLAIVNVLGIKMTTASIAAFLMLIGYSVDTDILLSTKVLKRRDGSVMERVYSAMKTGMMMTTTTMCAIIAALFVSQSPTISQIMTILLIGLVIDVLMTYLQNVGLLRWHLERKKNE